MRLRHRIDAVRAVTTPRAVQVDPGVLVAVSEAVHRGEVLRFDHLTDGAGAPRRTEPYAVVARHGRWYLLAWDLDRADWRTYRVDRMAPRSRTGVRFTPREVPGGDAAAFVAARFKGSEQADAWPCTGSVTVSVEGASILAPYLPGDGRVDPSGPGRCRVTLGSWSWTGLAAVFAGFPVDFTVDGPPPLRDALRALADRLRAASAR